MCINKLNKSVTGRHVNVSQSPVTRYLICKFNITSQILAFFLSAWGASFFLQWGLNNLFSLITLLKVTQSSGIFLFWFVCLLYYVPNLLHPWFIVLYFAGNCEERVVWWFDWWRKEPAGWAYGVSVSTCQEISTARWGMFGFFVVFF